MNAEDMYGELTEPGAQELLRKGVLARLAYTGLDNLPRVIPIGFHWNGEVVVVCTAPISPKVGALSFRPDVALTIDTDVAAAKALLMRGRASIEIVDGVPAEYIAASAKSMDDTQLEAFEAHVRSVYKQMAKISIEPYWARFYNFGAARLPNFLHRLLDAN
jgi:hypothetical protein